MHGPDREIEAKVEYGDGQYRVVLPGNFVICAVTGRRIALESLRYWSVERQEAYVDAAAAMAALRGGKP
jgi:hypothetical protein